MQICARHGSCRTFSDSRQSHLGAMAWLQDSVGSRGTGRRADTLLSVKVGTRAGLTLTVFMLVPAATGLGCVHCPHPVWTGGKGASSTYEHGR